MTLMLGQPGSCVLAEEPERCLWLGGTQGLEGGVQ